MKKFTAFITALSIVLCGTGVFADTEKTVGAKYENEVLTVDYTNNNSRFAILNIYDGGMLFGSSMAVFKDGKYEFPISDAAAKKDLRIVYENGEIYDANVSEPEPISTPKPTKEPFPKVYEREVDAINAPAIITGISQVQENGEDCFRISMLYQGSEIVTNVSENVKVVSAPLKDAEITGGGVGNLKVGDIIHFSCYLSGKIKNIRLIHRPEFTDYIANGTDFATLFGNDGYSKYSFGAVIKTYGAGIETADENGVVSDIDVSPDAIVYSVSKSSKTTLAEASGIGAKSISKTYVPDGNFDDNGNITSWQDVTDIVYVLVRETHNTATDIVVFE